jgi:Zn-dependent M28 family amino/carboxypeptidase
MLLDLARLLEPYDLVRSLRFVTFGSEELGLHGSKSYAAAREDLSQIVCVLNLDCPAVREGELTITTNENPRLRTFFEELSSQLHVDVVLKRETTLYSDHYPFIEAGVPAAQFLSRGSAYIFSHTEYDTLDKLSPESFTVPLIVAGVSIIECAMRDELYLRSS